MSSRIIFTLIVFLAVANVLVWSFLGVEKAYAQRVYPGIWVQAQPLAGLTKEQVVDRLEPINRAMLLQKVTLKLADGEYLPTLSDLGYSVDTSAMADAAISLGRGPTAREIFLKIIDYRQTKTVPMTYTIDQGRFDSYLNDIGRKVTKEPKNLQLTFKNGAISTTPAEDGMVLDREQIRQAIQQQVRPGKTAFINLQLTTVAAPIREENQISLAREKLAQLLSGTLTLLAEDQTHQLTPDDIYSFIFFDLADNNLTVNIDQEKVTRSIGQLAKKVDTKPIAKEISILNGEIIKEGQDGRELDVPGAVRRVMERLSNSEYATPIVLKTTIISRQTKSTSPEFVLGRFAGRYLEIDLSAQRMHLIEGNQYHKTSIISTGAWTHPTPTGQFAIKNHIKTAWSKRYGLYMPLWMAIQTPEGLYDGYGLHGLPYWPNGRREGESHLGKPVSHGCIRLGSGDIEYLYEWAQDGTPVVIHQ